MQLVVSTRLEKRNKNEEKSLLWHNVRASKVVDNVRDDSKNIKVFGFDNERVSSIELNTNNKKQNIRVLEKLQKDIDTLDLKMEEDYKKEKGKKIPKNAVKFFRGVITFGSDRVVEEIESKSLTEEEVEAINQKNENDMDLAALDYMKKLEQTYGIKICYVTRHDDEKTRHYHFTATQYDFANHKMLTSGWQKKDMQKFGETLQDLVASSFSDLGFKRGKKGSKNKHLTIKNMHSNEIKNLKIESMKLSKEITKKNQVKIQSDINYHNFVSAKEAYEFQQEKKEGKWVPRAQMDNLVKLLKTKQRDQILDLRKDAGAVIVSQNEKISSLESSLRIEKKRIVDLKAKSEKLIVAQKFINENGLTEKFKEYAKSDLEKIKDKMNSHKKAVALKEQKEKAKREQSKENHNFDFEDLN